MINRLILIVFTCLVSFLLMGCDDYEKIGTSNVRVRVLEAKDTSRRFWATFVDTIGNRYEHVRIGYKRCHGGPSNLTVGTEIVASVNVYRHKDTGAAQYRINRQDLRARFC